MAMTRFLVLSDTNDVAFPHHSTIPPVDVVLHCGNLTMVSGLSKFRAAVEQLVLCDAELKILIAGNHDVSLGPKWWADNLDEGDDPNEPAKVRDLLISADAIKKGIHFLDEGTHSFKLQDGRSFSIYASPYTPEFNGCAFSYEPGEDRFNDKAENPIPRGVDIVMTHRPPLVPHENYRINIDGKGKHSGCPKL